MAIEGKIQANGAYYFSSPQMTWEYLNRRTSGKVIEHEMSRLALWLGMNEEGVSFKNLLEHRTADYLKTLTIKEEFRTTKKAVEFLWRADSQYRMNQNQKATIGQTVQKLEEEQTIEEVRKYSQTQLQKLKDKAKDKPCKFGTECCREET
ncbi:hypothetical protein BDD12DRAFT_806454 [Trichophaea hybrida]|nr:hypothetical protein BDD12DRAFT_806454 [Trichophaea hybrida]